MWCVVGKGGEKLLEKPLDVIDVYAIVRMCVCFVFFAAAGVDFV